MTKKLLVSWTKGLGSECQGGKSSDLEWGEVNALLSEIANAGGTLTVDVIDGPEIGPQSLQVQTENGYSVISLGEDTGEDYVVRTYVNGAINAPALDILGERWDSELVCQDYSTVRHIFEEFFVTGDVSKRLLRD
jgi:hypothetical protein